MIKMFYLLLATIVAFLAALLLPKDLHNTYGTIVTVIIFYFTFFTE